MATTERTRRSGLSRPRTELDRRRRVGAVASFAYAVGCYAAFVLLFGYAVAFLADAESVVPRTVDRGGPHASTVVAFVVDTLLLGVFAVQHSVMARPGFKRRWVRIVPRQVERATYVLASTAALALAFWQWRPIPTVVWDISSPVARTLVWALCAAGWLWALAMTFAIDHLDLFGLRQVARHLRGLAESAPGFAQPWPYRRARHPMMIGFIVAFVATPTMTVGHLLFAALSTAYVLVGVRLEERDLRAALPEYAGYAATTPQLIPRSTGRRPAQID
jgi:protein-S-isoprenylcysteine O-methyltransferase Ste14